MEEIRYYAVDEDPTEKLENEDNIDEPAEDDEEDEDIDSRTNGQKLYEFLRDSDLVTDGEFEDLTARLRKGWESAASALAVADLDQELFVK